jgi:SAM-dependent methyltransferase
MMLPLGVDRCYLWEYRGRCVLTDSKIPAVDPTNAEQARAWDGSEGAYWAAHPERFDQAMAAYHGRVLEWADIGTDDRVLDIGCGTGQATRDAARAASNGSAFGVDLSRMMVEVARRLVGSQYLDNATFEQADAQIYPFAPGSFDVAISRTGTMFFGDPEAAFANVARAVRAGGRLVMLVWQGPGHNQWIRELTAALSAGRDLSGPPVGAPGPFALADPERTKQLLSAAGFADVEIGGVQGPMWFGHGPADAQRFVVGLMGWMLDGLNAADTAEALDALRTLAAAHQGPGGVTFDSAAWMVRAARP